VDKMRILWTHFGLGEAGSGEGGARRVFSSVWSDRKMYVYL
jgi:hypothetical protein